MTPENPFSLLLSPSGACELLLTEGLVTLGLWVLFFLGVLSVLGAVAAGRRLRGSADLSKGLWQVQVGVLYLICTLAILLSPAWFCCRELPDLQIEITANVFGALGLGFVVLAGELAAIRLRFGRGAWRHDWALGLLICPLLDLFVLAVCIFLVLSSVPKPAG